MHWASGSKQTNNPNSHFKKKKMQYSPKLKAAMEEIKAILKKHDIAGFVVIHTPGFSEYLNEVSPSYSCAKIEESQIRFKVKASEVGGPERAREIANETFNMITHFADMTAQHAMMYIAAKDMLKTKLGGEQFPGEHTSHDQQNN